MTIQKIGFYGFGNLAKRLYLGFDAYCRQQNISCQIYKRQPFTEFDIHQVDQQTLITNSDVIILAIKPQQLDSVIDDLKRVDWSRCCLVSLLAGTPIQTFVDHLPQLKHMIRMMPNTAAEFNQSMTVYSVLKSTKPDYTTFIHDLFQSAGSVLAIDESQMHFCTALCGSGPAFFYQLCQILIDQSKKNGFSDTESRLFINQLLQGIASTLNQQSSTEISTLIQAICSPNGTTQAGLDSMKTNQLHQNWQDVFSAAKTRSQELSK